VDSTVEIRTKNVSLRLSAADVALLLDELTLIGSRADWAAETLRRQAVCAPRGDDLAMLARALDHLRNLGRLPPAGASELTRLRDLIIDSFGTRTLARVSAGAPTSLGTCCAASREAV
jgi:hypothetical protein